MALTSLTLPAIPPLPPLPVDASLEFASAQTITATGYVNNVNQQIDLANGATLGVGRHSFFCALDLTAESGTSEGFQFYVMGSNDVNWGNGNVENLTAFDTAPASAQRMVTTIMGASPTIPDAGRVGSLVIKPFWNLGQGMIVYRYLRLYCVAAGTTPSLTLSAWVVPFEMKY